ncbi:MAG: hypothetical protein M3409_00215 [Gemmatimonadota bacterium]|nr:hypothetical protein [Gemmatimonadota bacterium]
MNDTSPEMAALQRSLLMERSGAERFVMGTRMFAAARRMALASFPPGLPPDEVRRRLFERFYGDFPAHLVPAPLRRR